MRHPRRNELFRDVGGALHDKDEDDFVEVVEAEWTPEHALLLCTDGLTDMVPSATIEQLVVRHAGRPQQVADALVDAANDAGGHDNVTVVYAEGAAFATWARQREASTGGAAAQDRDEGLRTTPRRPLRTFARWVVGTRTTWFAIGALAGVLAALGLVWRVGVPDPRPGRTLVAGTETAGAFPEIGAALAAAQPGDTVRLEPGVYAERIVVPDGVELVARVPGSATLRRAPATTGEWVAVTAPGTRGGRVTGLRIESTPDAPIDIAVRVTGQGRTFDLMDVIGPVQAALELTADASVLMEGSVLEVPAVAVRLGEAAHATLTNTIVSHVGRARIAPVSLAASAQVTLSRNVFAGFGPALMDGPGAPPHPDLGGSFVLGADPRANR
jgi:hypothetical protein